MTAYRLELLMLVFGSVAVITTVKVPVLAHVVSRVTSLYLLTVVKAASWLKVIELGREPEGDRVAV